ARERVDGARFHLRRVGVGGAGAEMAVDAVARGQDDFLALGHGDERRNVRMEAIVTGLQLISQTLATVDLDALHDGSPVDYAAMMTDKPPHVYVILGNAQWDFADCQTALSRVPARMFSLPQTEVEDEMIARTRDADALVVSSAPVTRGVMSALEGLKVVVRTGVGYDVIDVPAATEPGVIVVNIPDLWIREVANHALALLLAWNRKLITLNNEVKSGIWQTRVPGPVTGSLHDETVGVVGLGNIGSAFAKRVAALETHVIACDPYVDDA